MDKLRILINAYACSPNMGSEPGMAWHWVSHLARHCELHVITEGEFREQIEAVVPTLPQGQNLYFYYNPVSEEIRRMCWNQGDWRFYKYYRQWQWKTYLMAKELCQKEHIDLLHQLNMIGFREPGYLWRLSRETGVPFVWGPVDAKDKFPVAYLQGADLKTQLFMRLKNFLTVVQLRYSRRVSHAARQASVVFSASSNSQRSFQKYLSVDSPLLNETGCYVQERPLVDKSRKATFDVLWVGKMDFRKQLTLALWSIAAANNLQMRLHIVGGGNAGPYQRMADDLGIGGRCVWHGMVSHARVQDLMRDADVLLFTSVAEGTPHVVLESIGNNLPVVCFDTCGQGDVVNSKVGRKISLSHPRQSAQDFARLLNELEHDRGLLGQLAASCKERQAQLSWEEKAQTMVAYYEKCVRPHNQQ